MLSLQQIGQGYEWFALGCLGWRELDGLRDALIAAIAFNLSQLKARLVKQGVTARHVQVTRADTLTQGMLLLQLMVIVERSHVVVPNVPAVVLRLLVEKGYLFAKHSLLLCLVSEYIEGLT